MAGMRFVIGLALAAGAVSGASAATGNRLSGDVAAGARVAIAHSVHPKARLAADMGAAEGTTRLESMSLRFNMTDAQAAALDQLLLDQQNPASARYHQWLTPAQFGAQFGLSAADLATVTAWLSAQGFTVTAVAHGGMFVTFSGTVAQAQAAFSTSIHRVSLDGETHLANVTEVTLPGGIAAVTAGVTGLDDFKLKPRVRTQFTSTISGTTYIAPGDFYTIYDENGLLNNSVNGTGVTIAVVGQTDVALTDVAAFRTASGLTANAPTVMLYGCDPGNYVTPNKSCVSPSPTSGDQEESSLDLEWAGAVAPSAKLIFVNGYDVFLASLTGAVDNNIAPIMTSSYGGCESGFGSALMSLNALFKQANAQGITLLGPAGDDGATDCEASGSTSATGGLAVDFPASSPYVTGVGGTMFNEGTGTYFGTSNNANAGSAISYIPEAVWNETATYGSLAGGGGGVSLLFPKPAWQTGAGVPADASRDVPDVSLDSAARHDAYLLCFAGSCTNGTFRGSNGTSLTTAGGTSFATPEFAAVLALVLQRVGGRLGNVNPTIYALANSTYYNSVFHDVTVGNNAMPCTTGSTGCPGGGSLGYSAGVGYDLATGWGSVDISNLVADWKLVTPLSVGTLGGVASAVTLKASANPVSAGTAVTLTATVASGSGTSTVPTGSVQFLVDNVAVGGSVTLANGQATYTLSTSALTSGNHSVSVSYGGDTTYAGSKGTLLLDLVSATAADFSLASSAGTLTLQPGATGSVTYTVTPVNAFTGTVAFSVTSATGVSATGGFAPTSVTITSTASGSTVLTISAYTANTGIIAVKASASGGGAPWYVAGSGVMAASLMLLVLPRRRRLGGVLGLALLGAVVGAVTGCGSSSNGTVVAGNTNAAAGTYALTVTGTSTSTAGVTTSHTSNLTLIVP